MKEMSVCGNSASSEVPLAVIQYPSKSNKWSEKYARKTNSPTIHEVRHKTRKEK